VSRDRRRETLRSLFAQTRAKTESLAAPLSAEDQQLQSMEDASPTKWHRAHTTWFFEAFVVAPAGGPVFDGRYAELFNSYYESVGPRHPRGKRGVLSRPTAAEVGEYRRAVDARVTAILTGAQGAELDALLPVVELGIAHEEQHQELILTDILHAFSENPLRPAYRVPSAAEPALNPTPMRFVRFDGGVHEMGAPGDDAFSFDNERPRHKVWVEPFELADRPVTVGELIAFLREDGYRTPSLWLSDGLEFVRAHGVCAPLHARFADGVMHVFGLTGPRVAADSEPVGHLSYFEADALARFLGARLPTEAEWELSASSAPSGGNFLEDGTLHPVATARTTETRVHQLFGDVWEWTRSAYSPYPGYEPPAGTLGEYNGKFMIDQCVLRGGSCLTPRRHVRSTYRNFWRPATRFQMTGLRLARDLTR
jgi:ergothioneine biosynthesis protein EgtB